MKKLFIGFLALTTLIPAWSKAPWSIDDFIDGLKSSEYPTIEAALESLPIDVRSQFSLVHEGHGLRGTSLDKPGVILYSRRGQYAITFGDESLALGNELEVMRFNKEQNKIELFSAKFSNNQSVVEKNPKQCLTCHGQDPMLLWSQYRQWPGVFGVVDDLIREGTPEYTNFMAFMSEMKNKKRYNLLRPVQYQYGIPLQAVLDLKDNFVFAIRPNTLFSFIAPAVNGQRVARILMTSPLYKKERIKLLKHFIRCDEPTYVEQLAKNKEFYSLLNRFGITGLDLAPDILTPNRANRTTIPGFTDGISTILSVSENAVLNYAGAVIAKDILKAYPSLELNDGSFHTALVTYKKFKTIPSTLSVLEDLSTIGPYLKQGMRGYKPLCDQLTDLQREI